MKAVSGKELCRALERKGWHLSRVKGSHHVYKLTPPGGAPPSTVIVPVHRNDSLPTGTQRGIMKAAGLTAADL